MVPNDFDWRKYSQEHNLTNDRYWQIKDFCYRYNEMKNEEHSLMMSTAGSIIRSRSILDARSARQTYADETFDLAAQFDRWGKVTDQIKIIEFAAADPDKRLARPMLIFLTDKKYSHSTLVEFLDDQRLAVKPEYFEKCWRYAICMIDANLKKLHRKNHSTK